MSPTQQLDTSEGFSDWSECIDSQCASSDDRLEEYVEASTDEEYARAQQDSDPLERVWHSEEGVTVDKGYMTLLGQPKPPQGEGYLNQVLSKADDLTKLGDNWDGEGSLGYSAETLRRVRKFLLLQSSLSTRIFRRALPIPQINPADEGSMDVFWRLPQRQLLLNFPRQTDSPVTYHGRDDTGRNTITGRAEDSDPRQDLVAWLIQSTM